MNAVEYWLSELANKSEGTRQKYKDYFNRFCQYVNKSAADLLKQRQEDLRSPDIKQQRTIETALKNYIAHLRDTGNSPATQQVAYAAIRSFFEMHYVALRMRRGDYPTGESLGSRAITKELIQKILADEKTMKNPLKIRALIFFLKDTGFRVSDVRRINYGDLADGLERGDQFIPISLVTQKYKTTAKTFIGPEAIEAIKQYLNARRMGTRRIPPEQITHKTPLFRTSENGTVKRLSRNGLSSMLRFQCLKTGETKLSAHSFRKYFQTQLEAAGVNPNWIDQMIGHRLINSRDSYSLPTDQQLKEAYMKAYPFLRIYSEKSEVEDRVTQLEKQLTERNTMIADLLANGEKKNQEFAALAERIRKIENSKTALELLLHRIEQLENELRK